MGGQRGKARHTFIQQSLPLNISINSEADRGLGQSTALLLCSESLIKVHLRGGKGLSAQTFRQRPALDGIHRARRRLSLRGGPSRDGDTNTENKNGKKREAAMEQALQRTAPCKLLLSIMYLTQTSAKREISFELCGGRGGIVRKDVSGYYSTGHHREVAHSRSKMHPRTSCYASVQ